MIKIGSDFSGVGSFNQALQRLKVDYKELFACDIDKHARQTFALNFLTDLDVVMEKTSTLGKLASGNWAGDFYYPHDVYDRKIPEDSLDIYLSSPPCQAFSMAGKRKGEDDKRGILFYNTHEFIVKNNPRYFIIENVKGLLSDDNGKTFQRWIDLLAGKSVNGNPVLFPHEESAQYHVYYKVLNAKNYGIPQNRERIFIIGIRDDADHHFIFPKPIPLRKKLKDVLETEVDKKYFLSDKMLDYLNTRKDNFNNGKINYKTEDDIATTLTKSSGSIDISDKVIKVGYVAQDTQGSQVFSEKGVSPTISAGTHGYSMGYVETKIGTWRTHEDGKGFRATEDNNCPTIPARAREDGSGQPVVMIGAFRGRNPENPKSRKKGDYYEQILEINPEGISNTMTSVSKDNVVVEQRERELNQKQSKKFLEIQTIRRLTPLECFRLMDFNFGIKDVPDFKWTVSDSQAYKQAGNSIPVGLLVALIERLPGIVKKKIE